MSRYSDILNELGKRIKDIIGIQPIVLDQMPAVMKDGAIYIVSPDEGSIVIRPMISSDSWQDFTVHIYCIAHEQSMNRQTEIVGNIEKALDKSNFFLEEVFPRLRKMTNVAGAVMFECNYGTSTWVTDTKIYTAVKVTLRFHDVLED